tara:strand:- start:378 stop:1016 length:639 start_codon:yes stop_codon:yes gene_type:complete
MDYKKAFIKLCIEKEALKFGKFELKSGRTSPFFFNSGVFTDGQSINLISELFLQIIKEKKINFTNIFGPAYKGIPLAAGLAQIMFKNNMGVVNFVFDRKDEKKHGEGGELIGTFLPGDTIIVDDVITAGTAIKKSLENVNKYEIQINDLIVLLDRKEKGESSKAASEEIKMQFNIDVHSIITIHDILKFIGNDVNYRHFKADVEEYIANFGV